MNDSHLTNTGFKRLLKVFLDDARDVLRSKGMQVDCVRDRKNYWPFKRVVRGFIEAGRRVVIPAAAHKKRGQIALPSG
jgi:hypothetical protein